MSTATDIIAGGNAFIRYASGTQTLRNHSALVVQEDTVFTSFSVDGTNVLSARGMSGVTFKQGAYLPAGNSATITGFVISSGSVIGY
jgi:hypothetical protein